MTKDLRALFIDELKDMYDAEHRLTKAIPKLVKAANHEELAAAFESHLEETREHVTRLEKVFESVDQVPMRKACKAMIGLIEEAEELIEFDGDSQVQDAALIAAAQKVEHYEIATYGCLRTWANLLGEASMAKLLQQTLDEEGEADKKLTEIADSLELESAESAESDGAGDEDEDEDEAASAGASKRRETVTAGRKPANGGRGASASSKSRSTR